MTQNDYMNRSLVMQTADRMLMHYISSAAYHLRQAEEYLDYYKALEHPSYYKGLREEWPQMASLYKQLSRAEITAALVFVFDLEEVGLLDLGDWLNISHFLNWFGIPAEDRYD